MKLKYRTIFLIVFFIMLVDLTFFPSMIRTKLSGIGTLAIGSISVSISELINISFIIFLFINWRYRRVFHGLPKWNIVCFHGFILLAVIAFVRGAISYGIILAIQESRVFVFLIYMVAIPVAFSFKTILYPFSKQALKSFKFLISIFLVLKLIGRLGDLSSLTFPIFLHSSWESSLIILFIGILAFSKYLTLGPSIGRYIVFIISGIVVLLSFSKPVYFATLITCILYGILLIRIRAKSIFHYRLLGKILTIGLFILLLVSGAGKFFPFHEQVTNFWQVRIMKRGFRYSKIADVDLSSGRFDIWRTGLVRTKEDNLLLGFGIGAKIEPEYSYYSIGTQSAIPIEAHNLFVHTIFSMGYIGGVLLFLVAISFFFQSIHFLERLVKERDMASNDVAIIMGCCVFFWSIMGTSMVGLVTSQPRITFIVGICLAITICGMGEIKRRKML